MCGQSLGITNYFLDFFVLLVRTFIGDVLAFNAFEHFESALTID
jgi:hypothetical protein